MATVAAFIFSQFGLLASTLATNFDTLSMFTNFLILPLIYLGGLFYPVSELADPWSTISKLNPLYYLIEGFRSAILGTGHLSFVHSFTFAFVIGLLLFVAAARVITTGYKLRS